MLWYGLMMVFAVAGCWWAKLSRDKMNDCLPEEAGKYRKNIAFGILISFLPLFLISALRWNVGTDTWHTYTPEYLAIKSQKTELSEEEKQILLDCGKLNGKWDLGYSNEKIENMTYQECQEAFQSASKHTAIGFQLLERFLLLFNADVQWLYVLTSLIILLFVYVAIWKQSSMPVLALLLFVLTSNFFLSLNIVSQFMAISICLFACTYAQERKPILFFAGVALAACFHISALVFIPVYFLPKLKMKPLWCSVAIAAMFLIAQFAYPLISRLVQMIAPQYARYLNDGAKFEWIFFAIGLAVFAAGTYYWPKGKDRPYYKLWYYANVIGLLALCFSSRIPGMKRINYYFAAPHFLLLPLIVQCEEQPMRKKLVCTAIVLLFLAETIVAVGMMNKNGVLPYQVMINADRPALTESFLATLLQ